MLAVLLPLTSHGYKSPYVFFWSMARANTVRTHDTVCMSRRCTSIRSFDCLPSRTNFGSMYYCYAQSLLERYSTGPRRDSRTSSTPSYAQLISLHCMQSTFSGRMPANVRPTCFSGACRVRILHSLRCRMLVYKDRAHT